MEISRRGAVKLLSTSGLGMVLAASTRAGDESGGDKRRAAPSLFVVGPYPLGDLYQRADKTLRTFAASFGVRENELVAALNHSRVYVIDQRLDEQSRFRFPARSDCKDYPRFALEGPLSHELTDTENNRIELHVSGGFRLIESQLETEVRRPFRTVSASVSFRVFFSGKASLRRSTYNAALGPISYDVAGQKRAV